MNIFILEDDFIQQTRIESIVHNVLHKNDWMYKHCEVYGKPDQLLAAVSERGNHQIFFLDMEIKGERQKGLDVALEIRKLDPMAAIVFVTSYSELMPVAFQYQVSALDFIGKELSESDFANRIEKNLTYVYHNQRSLLANNSFLFESSKSQIHILFSDLLYIETSYIAHKLILYSKREVIEFYGQLKDIVEQDSRLYHCHRSFVVNPYNISRIDKKERVVYFKNGASCFVAKSKIKSLLKSVSEIHNSRLRE